MKQRIVYHSGVVPEVEIVPHGNTPFCNNRILEINPAIGCEFQCQYCNAYAQEESSNFGRVDVFPDYPLYLDSFLANSKIFWGGSFLFITQD